MKPDVLVVGGGCAGLAAATALAEGGATVRLLEARPVLGGRSRSWVDAETGDVEDNGQHLVMGCYEALLAFLRRTGGIDGLEFQDRMEVVLVEPGGETVRFAPGRLPGPLGLLWGLLRLRGFPWPDALAAGGILRDARRGPNRVAGRTAAEWLERRGQSADARMRFWDPLILATMNLAPEHAPAELLAEVLRRALLGGPEASRLGFPRAGLGPLIVDPALRYLERRGAEVRLGCPVTALEWDERGRFAAAWARAGERHAARAAVLALPHREAATLLRGSAAGAAGPERAGELGASAIIAVHLWFDRAVSPHGIAGLIDSPVHWVFNRAVLGGAREPGYLALVTSAAGSVVRSSRDELVAMALAELRRYFPAAAGARLRRSRVLKERRATPALDVRNLGLRPPSRTSCPNLALAGDWTATGLPATLEGAAASGHRAAELLLGG